MDRRSFFKFGSVGLFTVYVGGKIAIPAEAGPDAAGPFEPLFPNATLPSWAVGLSVALTSDGSRVSEVKELQNLFARQDEGGTSIHADNPTWAALTGDRMIDGVRFIDREGAVLSTARFSEHMPDGTDFTLDFSGPVISLRTL